MKNNQNIMRDKTLKHISYLILADWVLFQEVLVTATNLENVFTLIFLNTHFELLW